MKEAVFADLVCSETYILKCDRIMVASLEGVVKSSLIEKSKQSKSLVIELPPSIHRCRVAINHNPGDYPSCCKDAPYNLRISAVSIWPQLLPPSTRNGKVQLFIVFSALSLSQDAFLPSFSFPCYLESLSAKGTPLLSFDREAVSW